MRHPCRKLTLDDTGVAALEFAIIAPVLLMIFGGIADFGLLLIGKGQLANGMAQAVNYALSRGASVPNSVMTAMAKDASARSGVRSVVSVNVVGPACYCLSGQPAVLSASATAMSSSYTCPGTCPASAASPAAYMTITTQYTFTPLMPLFSQLAPTQVAQTATVRLQ